jgi:hypothetical protein
MNMDVVESDGIWLCSSSTHAPDLVAAFIIIEVLVMSCVGHCERKVGVSEWIIWEVFKILIAKLFCILNPAIWLSFESPVEDFVGCVLELVLTDTA